MDVATLPDDVAALKAMITTLARQAGQPQLKALRLEHQLEQLKKRYYDPRADEPPVACCRQG